MGDGGELGSALDDVYGTGVKYIGKVAKILRLSQKCSKTNSAKL